MSNEKERVRGKIAKIIWDQRLTVPQRATEILSQPGIAVLADDQSLPENNYYGVMNKGVYDQAQQDMLKVGWVKGVV